MCQGCDFFWFPGSSFLVFFTSDSEDNSLIMIASLYALSQELTSFADIEMVECPRFLLYDMEINLWSEHIYRLIELYFSM